MGGGSLSFTIGCGRLGVQLPHRDLLCPPLHITLTTQPNTSNDLLKEDLALIKILENFIFYFLVDSNFFNRLMSISVVLIPRTFQNYFIYV